MQTKTKWNVFFYQTHGPPVPTFFSSSSTISRKLCFSVIFGFTWFRSTSVCPIFAILLSCLVLIYNRSNRTLTREKRKKKQMRNFFERKSFKPVYKSYYYYCREFVCVLFISRLLNFPRLLKRHKLIKNCKLILIWHAK